MNLFQLIGRYFWVIILVTTSANHFFGLRRIEKAGISNLENGKPAKDYLRRFTLFRAAPWLVMGFGQTVGGIPSVWYYFRP